MDSPNDRRELLLALAVTAELTGTELSEPAARLLADDLGVYPLRQVLVALTRCRRELRGRLTLAAIIDRLDDGRPGPNEAWAMIPQDEHGSVVWTTEMAEAYGIAAPLLREGQVIAARSAFIEAYSAAVTMARAQQQQAKWEPSLGGDPTMRAAALEEAVRKCRLTQAHVDKLLPAPARGAVPLLANPAAPPPERVREQLRTFLTHHVVSTRKH
jgi:hypothetical protein